MPGQPPPLAGLSISIHALREEGDRPALLRYVAFAGISIHALREEGDVVPQDSCRRVEISIHALREEGDDSR